MNLFIGILNSFTKDGKVDKNGDLPVIINVLAGKCPNKRIISQAWVNAQDMKVGEAYQMTWTEGEASEEHGRNFTFNKVKLVSALEIMQICKEVPAEIFDVLEPAKVTEKQFQQQDN